MVGDAERAWRIDGVFGDIAEDAGVVAKAGAILRQRSALLFHLRCQLPGPADHFVDTAHALAVGAQHRNGADVVEHILGGNSLPAITAFRVYHTFPYRLIQLMAN